MAFRKNNLEHLPCETPEWSFFWPLKKIPLFPNCILRGLQNISLVTSLIRCYIKLWQFNYEVKVMQSPHLILVSIFLPASVCPCIPKFLINRGKVDSCALIGIGKKNWCQSWGKEAELLYWTCSTNFWHNTALSSLLQSGHQHRLYGVSSGVI